MRVLVTGSRGQLGTDVMAVLAGAHVPSGADLPEFDLTDAEQVEARVRSTRPEAIVNCAAFTRVDDCETREAAARAVNAEGPRLLARAARTAGALLLHVSTDYVFDGGREPPEPYDESDTPCPVSAYGRTKLAGEQAVAAEAPRHVILRTAWLYGRQGPNFPKTILRKALQDPAKPLRVVDDQFGCPTWSGRLAAQIARVLDSDAHGVYHAAALGRATWYEFSGRMLTALGVPHAIEPCRTEDYPTPARRPRNSILRDRRLQEEGLCVMADWREDVEAFARTHGPAVIEEVRATLG